MVRAAAPIATLILLCLLIASCGGTATEIQLSARNSGPDRLSEPQGTSPFGAFPSVEQALKAGSATAEQRFRFASEYAGILTGGSTVDGTNLLLQPDFDSGADPPSAEFSWAVYQFTLADFADDPILVTGWDETPRVQDMWVGIGRADWATWEWSLTANGNLDLEDLEPYLLTNDTLVVAVVLLGTQDHQLEWLRMGGPVEPVAQLTADPTEGGTPLSVSFDATGSFARGSTIAKVEWDFDGNGVFGEEANGEFAAQDSYTPEFNYEDTGTFNPAVRITDGQGLSADASVEIVTAPTTFAISGTVFASDGSTPLSGAELTLSGDADDAAVTDETGTYSFTGLDPGSYTITPAIYGKFFDPWDLALEITDADLTDQDFTAVDPWLKTWGGSEEDTVSDIVHDGRGNIYAVGRTMSFGTGWEVLIVKYNYKAELQWARTWGGGENEIGQCAVLGPSGDLYVTGYTTSFGAGGYDLFVLRISPEGQIVWQTTWGNVALQEGFDIVLDDSENVYIAGRLSNKTALIKLNSAGEHVWGQLYWADGSSFNYTNQLVLSGDNIYMSGFTYYSSPSGDYNTLVLKYTLNGDSQPTLDWAREWNKGTEDMLDQLVLDGSGNVIAAGHCNAGNGAQDGLVLGYSSVGGLLYENVWGTTAFELFYDLIFDGTNAYVAGMYGSSGRGLLGEVNPASGALNFSQGFDMDLGTDTATGRAVIAFDNGVLLWGGSAPNINGSWGEVDGSTAGGAGTEPVQTIQENSTNTAGITQSTPAAELQDVEGTEDTGGGSSDFGLFMYLRPQP